MLTIGIDVGNYDTKTQHTLTPSSYMSFKKQNLLADEYVYYGDTFYSPTNTRDNQMVDKTENDYCLIMSLFGIAKEAIHSISNVFPNCSKEEMQGHIDNIGEIVLGVGLPAGFYTSQARKLERYYNEKFEDGLKFEYGSKGASYSFNLKLKKCCVFVQDVASVMSDKTVSTPSQTGDYIVIGIGGGTADIIPIEGGVIALDKSITLNLGSRVMYDNIIQRLQTETGKTYGYLLIENVLLDRPTILKDAIKSRIHEMAADFVSRLVAEIARKGVDIEDVPCVCIGGGALLMKPYMENDERFGSIEFIDGVNVNAKCYATMAAKITKAA